MGIRAVAAILCLQWALWATPVHGAATAWLAAAPAKPTASHCAPAPPTSPRPSRSGQPDGACLLHCSVLAQAAVGPSPSPVWDAGLLLGLPAAAGLAPRGAPAALTRWTSRDAPPPRDVLLRSSILRL
jgi:hypothetical protein